MGLKPFTPMRDFFPERLIEQVSAAPTGSISYCIHGLPDGGEQRFLFFIKLEYSSIQPVVDADQVPAEFSLHVTEEEAGGMLLTAEFTPTLAEPPFRCQLQAEFPWADGDAIRCFLVLMDQAAWPFVFVSEDSNYVLVCRVYANPMSDEDREFCRKLIAEHADP